MKYITIFLTIFILTFPRIDACDLANESKKKYAIELDTSGCGNILEEEYIILKLQDLGLNIIKEMESEEITFDYSISIDASYFKYSDNKSSSFEYTIYYKDTLKSTAISIDIDGRLTQKKKKFAIEFLNAQLLQILNNFPL